MTLLDAARVLLANVGWTAGGQAFVSADAVRALYDAVEVEEGARLRERLAVEGPLRPGEMDAALREARETLATAETAVGVSVGVKCQVESVGVQEVDGALVPVARVKWGEGDAPADAASEEKPELESPQS